MHRRSKHAKWYDVVEDALHESDSEKLPDCITDAENAVAGRLEFLRCNQLRLTTAYVAGEFRELLNAKASLHGLRLKRHPLLR